MRRVVMCCAGLAVLSGIAWGVSYLRVSYAHDNAIVWLTSGSLIWQSDAMQLVRDRDRWCTQRIAEIDKTLTTLPPPAANRQDASRPARRAAWLAATRARIVRSQAELRSERSFKIGGFNGRRGMITLWRPQLDERLIMPLWIPMITSLSGVAVYMHHRRRRRANCCCVACGDDVRHTSGWCEDCNLHTHPRRHTETIVMAVVLLIMGGILAWCAAQVWRPRVYSSLLGTIHLVDTIIAGLAIGLLIALPRRRTVPAGFCEACGYDVRGVSGPCPECGGSGHVAI